MIEVLIGVFVQHHRLKVEKGLYKVIQSSFVKMGGFYFCVLCEILCALCVKMI